MARYTAWRVSMADNSDKGLPRELRRLLYVIVGVVAAVELALWIGVGAGWFKR